MSEKKKQIAIMQPYFFPYIGYWQLIHAVDLFVIYDEGNYIKHGWIHRNRILRQGTPEYLGLKLKGASANKSIAEIMLVDTMEYEVEKIKRTLKSCYKKAPYYEQVYPVLEQVLDCKSSDLTSYLEYEIRTICEYLDINTKVVRSSEISKPLADTAYGQIAGICRITGISNYINPIGGMAYYNKEKLADLGVELSFLEADPLEYQQCHSGAFVPNMSVIDMLMCCGKKQTKQFLDCYQLK